MKVFTGGMILLVTVLAGCATQPPGQTISQERARVHTELAAQYYERAQLGVALEELGKALKAEPNYAPAYNVRGLINMALREDRQPEEDFQRSQQLEGVASHAPQSRPNHRRQPEGDGEHDDEVDERVAQEQHEPQEPLAAGQGRL